MDKNTSIKKERKKYVAIRWTCFGGEFLSTLAPFVIMGIVKYDEYFVQYNGTKMTLASVLAAALMGIALWLVSTKKFTNSFVTLIIGWATITFIFFLMGKIIDDISWIMLFGLIGILGAYGLDFASQKAKERVEEIDDVIETAEKEQRVAQYKEEQAVENSKKVKVKIKK